jgi:choice-of-anchor C domain-containing protein
MTLSLKTGLLTAAFLFAGLATASATTLVSNGSFEAGTAPGVFTTVSGAGAISDWNISAGTVDYIGTYWTASDGARSVDMNGNSQGTIDQTINGLTAGQTYKLTFDIGGNGDGGPTTKTMDVSFGGVVQSVLFDTLTGGNIGGNARGYAPITLLFTYTGAGTSALLSFASTTGGGFFGPILDNVALSAVPLPPAMLLFGGALLGMAGLRRFRGRASAIAA